MIAYQDDFGSKTLARPMRVENRADQMVASLRSWRPVDSSPRTIGARLQPEPTVISHAHAQMVDAADNFGDAMQELRIENLTPEGLADAVDAAAGQPRTVIDHAVRVVQGHAREAEQAIHKAHAALTPSRDAAAELRADRAWDRLKSVLDAAHDTHVIGVAARLIHAANADELAMLSSELRSYLQARDVSSDWLTTVLGQAAPELQHAIDRARRAAKAEVIVLSNYRALHRAMDEARRTGTFRVPRLVDPSPHDPEGP